MKEFGFDKKYLRIFIVLDNAENLYKNISLKDKERSVIYLSNHKPKEMAIIYEDNNHTHYLKRVYELD